MKKILSIIGLGIMVAFLMVPQLAVAVDTPVGLELSLLVDVSGSIDATEFNLQRQGYANVFSNPTFYSNIVGTGGSLAVNLIYWSAGTEQSQVVPWTLINSQATADAFAAAILAAPRTYSGNTAPGSAINFAYPLFATNGFIAGTQIIDVSGDGAQNTGADTSDARDAALAFGIDRINGLVILGETGLEAWYNANVKGGTGAFVDTASTFADFAAAIDAKITKEVQSVPEPGTLLLLGCALAGLYGIRRKTH